MGAAGLGRPGAARPHELDAYEAQLRLFDGLGLTGVEMNRAVGVVASFVRGAAKSVADARAAEQATGQSATTTGGTPARRCSRS